MSKKAHQVQDKKKSGKNTQAKEAKEGPFSEQLYTIVTKDYVSKLKTDLEKLKTALFQWSMATGKLTYYGKKDTQILKEYLKHHHDYYQQDQFQGDYELLPSIIGINYSQIPEEDLIFKSYNLFNKALWSVRFDSKFIARFNDFNLNQMFYVLGFVYYLATGHFLTKAGMGMANYGHVRPLEVLAIPFNRFFTCKIFHEKNMFIHIGIQKVPVIKNGVIKRYQYKSYMHFLDILGDIYVEHKIKQNERMNVFKNQIFNDVARKDHSEELEVDKQHYKHTNLYFFKQIYNDYTEKSQFFPMSLSDAQDTVFYPLLFKPYYISTAQMSTVIFDDKQKRWISKDHLNFMERKKVAEYQKQISDSLIKGFVDFQSAKVLVELLTKIPNFNINLTAQEKDVIGQNGNVLAIGRSGTGKTTCAVLRLFSIEMLFKIRMSIYKKKYSETVKDVRCGSDDIDNTLGLHCIFLTASPVLTHEIQRYYRKLTDNIKSELEKKKQKIKEAKQKEEEQKENQKVQMIQKPQMSFEELNESEVEIKEEEMVPQKVERIESKKSIQEEEQEKEINEQFEGLELKQDINNEGFNEEEEDIDELKVQFQENIKKYHNLYDLQEKDYPGFFTVKSFIMMIDGILPKPFFIRNKNTIINQDSNAAWHNERKGVMMIENYYKNEEEDKQINLDQIEEEVNYSDEEELQHQYLRQIQLKQKRDKQQLTKKLGKNQAKQILSFEVDYEYFVVHFWSRVVRKYYSTSSNITPHIVWTEIYSTIKGSATAHQYPTQFLNQNAYLTTSSNTFLTKEEKLDIYETFCQYERWKIKAGGYDIMDAVNYILNHIRFRGYQGPEIHYVMIDQVQDLPHAIVYLFSKIATYGVFYSGDTAQTIAKGVGFRFCDLKSLFSPHVLDSSIKLKAPTIKHLTVNFRSHNNILQLANSVVSSIEILFPKTIDRMKKQISDLNGPKPMILASGDEELLFYVLCGGEEKRPQGAENAIKKSPLEFGCDQVIIVRDQQSKNKIPAMLQHALCLTIYEAKGLEFNDVILFDFFAESPCPEKWAVLKTLDIITTQIPKEQYEKNLSKHKVMEEKKAENQQTPQEQFLQQIPVDEKFNKETNSYHVKKIVTSKHHTLHKDINDYAELCSQLKLLYTAITRPRKTLIIYDHGACPARSTIERIWERLHVIEIVTKEIVAQQAASKDNQKEELKIFNKIIAGTDKNAWKQQGLKMYARGYFDQAMKCFERSGHFELLKKAEANKHADDATKKLIEIESERNSIKQGFHTYKQMNNNQIAKIKKGLKKDETRAIERFKMAGELFEELTMFKQAGQCFFSGKLFERAFENFCKAFMNKQAAESLQMMNRYREAAQYYQKEQDYLKVVQCLDLINEWTLILEKIHQFTYKMSQYEKQALLKKYSALALEELVYQIQFQNEEEQNKPENNKVQIIEEQNSDEEEEWDSDDDPEMAAQRQYERKLSEEQSGSNPSRKNSEIEEEKKLIEIKGSIYQTMDRDSIKEEVKETKSNVVKEENQVSASASFSDLNDSKASQTVKEGPKSIQASFGDLNQSVEGPLVLQESVKPESKEENMDIQSLESSFSDLNAKYDNQMQPDIESIRSMVDPDDVWVKNSISDIGKKLHSQYSVIDDDEENYNLNVKIIKTKGNIFVQDQIMRKIINIVSIINSTVHEFFKEFKGYQSLISVNKKASEGDEQIDNRPEITQFQQIDPKFINIILDTLESFKLFKLCLFVCNRYHLPTKAGRYLISLGLKYSTNCNSNNAINPILLAPSNFRKTQIEKGILASIALHAIYQNVNSEFLKIKVAAKEEENKKSLGTYFIQGLVLEGLYKKAVFMVNTEESLKILANYNDVEAYRSVFNQKILKKDEVKETITFSAALPISKQELQYTKMLLKKVLFDISVANKFQSVSQRYYRQFSSILVDDKKLAEYKIPDYLPFTQLLIQNKEDFALQFKNMIQKGYQILQSGNDLEVLDFVGVFLLTVHNEAHQQAIIKHFENDSFLEFYRCAKHIHLALKKYKGKNAIKILQAILFMHQCYKINHCKSMNFIYDGFCFVQRTSTVANELVDNPNKASNVNHFAYFFQQDYNLLLAKISKVSQIIVKKYEKALIKLFTKRTNFRRQFVNYLPEDFVAYEEEILLKKALSREIELLMDPKSRTKMQAKAITAVKKPKQKTMSYDFKRRALYQYVPNPNMESSSDQQLEADHSQDLLFYAPNFTSKLRYMAPVMVDLFLQHSKNAKETVDGKELYGSGLNSFYREYTNKRGGFNLFDAIEFKKFKRVDLYAENVLSIIDGLTLHARHSFITEILTLLMVQYKSLQSSGQFSVEVTSDELKYFQGLKFVKAKQNQKKEILTFNNEEVNYLLTNNEQCVFEYYNSFVCQMSQQEIAGLICDYLDLLKEEQASRYVNFATLVLSYVLNISSNHDINESLRRILNFFGKSWKCQTLYSLAECRTERQFKQARKQLLEAAYKTILLPVHTIAVTNVGNLNKAIEESEFDYEVEGKILESKKKAASKIIRWWRAKRRQAKDKKLEGTYLELAVQSYARPKAKQPQTIRDIRLIQSIYSSDNILSQPTFLVRTQQARDELLSFLLSTHITSSLDFHFVLQSLNKIQQCRQHYLEYCSWDPEEIHQFDIDEIKNEMNELTKTIQVWKKDQKWMREKNVQFKKKKVFEVKWMTKNKGLNFIAKKRAGLKKQEMLKKKAQMIKRIK